MFFEIFSFYPSHRQLWQYQTSVINQILYIVNLQMGKDCFCCKNTFGCCTPDVSAFGIDHEEYGYWERFKMGLSQEKAI